MIFGQDYLGLNWFFPKFILPKLFNREIESVALNHKILSHMHSNGSARAVVAGISTQIKVVDINNLYISMECELSGIV